MRPDRLRIGGLTRFSTVDFPGRLSAVVFCQGCPWRCRYCHNTHLQPFHEGVLPWREVVEFLKSRAGLLDAVVFSGGEPTAQSAIENAIRSVRDLGFAVALHTAGIFPERLERLLPLLDWIGLDVKAPFDSRHDAITQVAQSWHGPSEALDLVIASGVDYEIRTTLHPALLDEPACNAIRAELSRRGAQPTRWQPFRPTGCTDPALIAISDR